MYMYKHFTEVKIKSAMYHKHNTETEKLSGHRLFQILPFGLVKGQLQENTEKHFVGKHFVNKIFYPQRLIKI